MSKKTVGLVLLIIGVLLALLSIFADSIGIGSYPGFNWAQITGTVVGAISAVVGGILSLSKAK